jgi:superfamily I DNA/RNA helicase
LGSRVCKKIKLSIRTTYQYSSLGKIKRAFLNGKAWNIQKDAVFPQKEKKTKTGKNLLPNSFNKDIKLFENALQIKFSMLWFKSCSRYQKRKRYEKSNFINLFKEPEKCAKTCKSEDLQVFLYFLSMIYKNAQKFYGRIVA